VAAGVPAGEPEPLFGGAFATPDGRARMAFTAEAPSTSPRQGVSFSTIDAFFERESRRLLKSPA